MDEEEARLEEEIEALRLVFDIDDITGGECSE